MARDESEDRPENEGLSTRMRDLILSARIEERRKPKSREHSGPDGERRRRTDEPNDDKRAS